MHLAKYLKDTTDQEYLHDNRIKRNNRYTEILLNKSRIIYVTCV